MNDIVADKLKNNIKIIDILNTTIASAPIIAIITGIRTRGINICEAYTINGVLTDIFVNSSTHFCLSPLFLAISLLHYFVFL